VYSIDAPGHGGSDGNFLSVPVYSELIKQFIFDLGGVEAVVAHSVGGFSLLYTFHRLPLIPVHKVVLMGSPGEATDFVDVFSSSLGLSKRTLALVRDHFVSEYQVGPEYFSAAKFAGSVNVAGLIIHDKEDKEAPFRHALDINHAWKRSSLMTTNGLGHNLKSSEVISAVTSFISDVQKAVVSEKDEFISLQE
jgi:pimeloyl-ACP methyl ester carboxylesterase